VTINGVDQNVGIGINAPLEKLHVSGTIRASNLAGGATNLTTDANGNIIRDPSDVNLKENINTLDGSLDKVLRLRGVSYDWKDTERFGTQTEIGFIAQEVEVIVPEVVRSGGDYKSINTRNLVAVVVGAVQEMHEIMIGFGDKIISTLGVFDRVETDELCVGVTCINEEELINLIENSNQSENTNSENEPEDEVTEDVVEDDSEEVDAEDDSEEEETVEDEEVIEVPEPEVADAPDSSSQ